MLNEIAEFKDYTEAPIYKRDNKNDNSFLGRFTREGIQGFEGFPRVLTIIARGYMFKNGSADIDFIIQSIKNNQEFNILFNIKNISSVACCDNIRCSII